MDIFVASCASVYGIGAVSIYNYKDGNMKPVALYSRSLIEEKNTYCQTVTIEYFCGRIFFLF